MFLLLLGAMYAVGSLVLVCSICAAAALSPEMPLRADAEAQGRVYSLAARR